jgi:hypothetical protein
MSIYVSGPKTLVEFVKEDTVLESPRECPDCGRVLWKHGRRKRRCESLQLCASLDVVRLLCSRCVKTFSVLPDFLEAGARFERSVSEQYVLEFISTPGSYCELAWAVDDGDRDDAAASVSRAFRAVSKAAIEAGRNLLTLHQRLLLPGLALDLKGVNVKETDAVGRVKSEQKRLQIRTLTILFALLRKHFGDDQSAICNAYRTLCLGFRLPTPHAMQYTLF